MWYHYPKCADQNIDSLLVRKARAGGQAKEGCIRVFWRIATKPEPCTACGENVKIGERAMFITIGEPAEE